MSDGIEDDGIDSKGMMRMKKERELNFLVPIYIHQPDMCTEMRQRSLHEFQLKSSLKTSISNVKCWNNPHFFIQFLAVLIYVV